MATKYNVIEKIQELEDYEEMNLVTALVVILSTIWVMYYAFFTAYYVPTWIICALIIMSMVVIIPLFNEEQDEPDREHVKIRKY